jgi:hypothetical protein
LSVHGDVFILKNVNKWSKLKKQIKLTATQSLHHLLEARQLWLLVPPVLGLRGHIGLWRHPLGQIVRAVLELRLG